jgi:hypothetical protein
MKDEDIASLDAIIEEPNLPEAEINIDPPADREPQARDDTGKFKGKEQEAPKAVDEPTKIEAPKVEPPKQEQRTIPLAAHLEERKAFKSELDALKAELAALKNPPKQPVPAPEFQEDPRGYIDHKVLSALEQTKQQVDEVKNLATQSNQTAEEMRFSQQLVAAEQQFVAQTPDYMDALAHIRQIRMKQLQVFDPNITEAQMRDQIIREELGLAKQMAMQGRNPAQVAYEIAKAYGHVPKAQQQQQAPVDLPKVAGPKQLPPDQTLGSGSGQAVEDTSGEADEFDKAFGELFGKRRRA